MANREHVDVAKRGKDAIGEWRRANPGDRLDLREADLRGTDLSGANLTGAHLVGADLAGVNLSEAYLTGASLRGASLRSTALRWAYLMQADLGWADLGWADLGWADLGAASLFGADLDGANFSGTVLAETTLGNVDLSSCLSLDTVKHLGPSTIGIDTLYRSKGRIPEAFLRGCGVPDSFIVQAKALVGAEEAIQFYSCFISYGSKDEAFCKRLHSRMRDEHLRVWFAPEDMKTGRKLHEQIDEAIRVHDKLLLVLSESSMRSDWVANEIRAAFARERREKKRILFPITLVPFKKLQEWKLIDSKTGVDLAEEIRQYYLPPDFRKWKDHDVFEEAFGRLLTDLKSDDRPADRSAA